MKSALPLHGGTGPRAKKALLSTLCLAVPRALWVFDFIVFRSVSDHFPVRCPLCSRLGRWPILGVAFSPHYDLSCQTFFLWLLHMLETSGVDALYFRPPRPLFPGRLGRRLFVSLLALLQIPSCGLATCLHMPHSVFVKATRVRGLCLLEQPGTSLMRRPPLLAECKQQALCP